MSVNRILRAALTVGAAAFLASCDIEAVAPMRTFDIVNVAKSGVPIAVNAMITGTFASKDWCYDEGSMAIGAIGTADVPIQAMGCKPAGDKATGQFQLTTSLVRTAGAANPETVVPEVLAGDLVRFAVFPHGSHKDLLSVGIFMDTAKLEQAKAQLMAMPVFKRGKDTGEFTLNLSMSITNDLPTPAKFYLKDVGAGEDLPSDESVLTIPPGGTDTVQLDDPVKQQQLTQQGWVNFFAMAAK